MDENTGRTGAENRNGFYFVELFSEVPAQPAALENLQDPAPAQAEETHPTAG